MSPSLKSVKTAAKKSSKKKPSGCVPFSISIAILTPDDDTEIHFGLTKGCNPDDTAFWIIDFILKEINAAGQMVTRVEVHVTVGKDDIAAAEAMAKAKKLSPAGLDLLETDVTDQARTDPNAPEMRALLVDTVRAGANA
jgi:hypothetical protein